MSLLKLRPGRAEREERIEPLVETAPPSTPYVRPKPVPPGPHQLGSATLANVETLTSMTSTEIIKVADNLELAAHETAEGLREFARRVHASGQMANESLANFVNVASTCADAARHMQNAIVTRDEPQPEPPAETKPADEAAEPPAIDLATLGEKIAAPTEPAP